MKLPSFLLRWLQRRASAIMASRPTDFVIGDHYLDRWYVIPRNPVFNIYLHRINKSDDDRALHDHPWLNASIVVEGGYWEHVILAGGCEHKIWRGAGSVTPRRGKAAHRLEVAQGHSATTFFITGPRFRQWGFHCRKAGWRHWRDFTDGADVGQVGRGCGE